MATGVQNISLTDYDSQMAEFARRQRMAQALQEQAAAPIEVQSYKGIQAPISSLSILSKALKSYAGARGERRAVEEKGALDKRARELAAARGLSYMPTEEPAPAPTAIAPQALAAALGAPPVMDTQSGASRAAGIASNPLAVAAPPPAAPPPGMVPNTQSGASIAMGMGPNPNAAPMPMPPAAPPPAPAGAMAPINVPTPRPAGPSVAQLQAGLNKAISDADSDPNPYVRQNAARMIPVIQQSISRAQQQADTADARAYTEGRVTESRSYEDTHTEALRMADVKRATDQAEALITGGQFSDAQANALRSAGAAGTEALNAIRSLAASKAWVAKHTILPQTEAKLLGYPDGSIVSRNDETQEVELKYNPNPDRLAQYNALTARINATRPTAASAGRLIPQTAAKGIIENRTALDRVERAKGLLDARPEGVGLKNFRGDLLNRRLDPAGVDLRSAIADFGSMIIHDRSGAAVTVSEYPRLKPFIPKVTDDPASIARNLTHFQAELESILGESEAFYSPENGYRPITGRVGTSDAAPEATRTGTYNPATRRVEYAN